MADSFEIKEPAAKKPRLRFDCQECGKPLPSDAPRTALCATCTPKVDEDRPLFDIDAMSEAKGVDVGIFFKLNSNQSLTPSDLIQGGTRTWRSALIRAQVLASKHHKTLAERKAREIERIVSKQVATLQLSSRYVSPATAIILRYVTAIEHNTKKKRMESIQQRRQDLKVCTVCKQQEGIKAMKCGCLRCVACDEDGYNGHVCCPDKPFNERRKLDTAEGRVTSRPALTAFNAIGAAVLNITAPECREEVIITKLYITRNNLRKWRKHIGEVCGLPAPTIAGKIAALAIGIMNLFPSSNIDDSETEKRDVQILVDHILSQPTPDGKQVRETVLDIDGKLQHLLLHKRAQKQRTEIAKPNLHRHTVPVLATVIAYLRLRLRLPASKNKEVDIETVAKRMNVGLPTFQQCKADLIVLI